MTTETVKKAKAHRAAKIAAGLCRRCSKPREPERANRTRCQPCAVKETAVEMARRRSYPERVRAQKRASYWANPKTNNAVGRAWREKARLRVYDAYGGAFCSCCGEAELAFLTIDHVNNDGHKYRKKTGGQRNGGNNYLWAIKNDFPPGLQVLCYNCNSGRYRNGGDCPHQKGAGHGNGSCEESTSARPVSVS